MQTNALSLGLPEPQHYPRAMARYGTNPYGEPEFRIVFAPSVKMLVGGEFADGYVGYRARPKYRAIGNKWIVERWRGAFADTGLTAEQYELRYRDAVTGLLLTGPYPARGAYTECHTFDACDPVNENLDLLIALLKKAERNDPRENQRAILESMAAEERRQDAERLDWSRELNPAFGIRAANYPGSKHGSGVKATKSAPMPKSANELGLPLGNGPAVVGHRNAIVTGD